MMNSHEQEDIKKMKLESKLLESQQKIYDVILENTKVEGSPKLMMINGPAQSGKTFLLKRLYEDFPNLNTKSMSGSVSYHQAAQFFNGDVIHRMIHNSTTLQSCKILFLDSAHLINAETLGELDVALREANKTDEAFGGMTVIICGDFNQLPAFPNKKKQSLSIAKSKLFQQFNVLHLEYDCQTEYTELLSKFRRINGMIEVPKRLFVNSEIELIKATFDELSNPQNVIGRVILAPHVDTVVHINSIVIGLIKENSINLISENKLFNMNGSPENNRPDLLEINLKDIPRAKIELKAGCIIMLTENVNKVDLTKGTRLVFRSVEGESLLCNLLDDQDSQIQCIPKWTYLIDMKEHPYKLKREQFPIEVGYAMTIHRVHSRHFKQVGIYNYDSAWANGQVYVAMSRCNTIDGIRLYSNGHNKEENNYHILNKIE